MKFILLVSLLSSSALAAPLLGGLLGGIAEVDAGGLSVLSPEQDTFKYNYNAGFGNYKGPQYVPYNAGAFNPYGFAPPGLPFGAAGAGGPGQIPGVPQGFPQGK
jgi:hypothetical protein